MTIETALLIISGVQAVLTLVSARSTASSTTMATLSDVISGLRTEVAAMHKQRKDDLEMWKTREHELMTELAEMHAYTEVLIKLLNDNNIRVPSITRTNAPKSE